eukprot:scaffold71364_cov55-Phaeocystis_antarctica.AAC.2
MRQRAGWRRGSAVEMKVAMRRGGGLRLSRLYGRVCALPPSLLVVLACLLWAGVGVREAMADGAGMCVAFMYTAGKKVRKLQPFWRFATRWLYFLIWGGSVVVGSHIPRPSWPCEMGKTIGPIA